MCPNTICLNAQIMINYTSEIIKTIYALRARDKKEKAISKEVHALHGVELSWQKIKKILNRKIQGMPQHAF